MIDLKKSAPLILSITASIGVVATAILSHKATLKAEERPAEERWKCYIPTVLVATGSICCIIGSNMLNNQQQASLANAYAMLFESFNQYKKKVIERHGIDEHNQILDEIRNAEHAQDLFVSSGCFLSDCHNFFDEDEEEMLFYDVSSKKYFNARPTTVMQAEYYLNRNFVLSWTVSLQDWYEWLGIEPCPNADKMIFNMEDGLTWIDFNHHKAVMNDGLECWVIDILGSYDSPPDG